MANSTLGLIVNPIAGLGGPLGLKGTDGADVLEAARAAKAQLTSPARALRALKAFAVSGGGSVLTGPGQLGEDMARAAGVEVHVVSHNETTGTSVDTTNLANAVAGEVGLILFAGGDGTARDIVSATGSKVPLLGIPAGVKMHSGVFARSPEAAGRLAAAFLATESRRVIDSEIMDIDEAARAEGYVSPQLFATAPTPAGGAALQGPKTPGDTGLADIDAALASYSKSMQPDTLYLIGPGTTMSALKARLGNGGTLLGVDAARDGRIIGRDLSAGEVEALLKGDVPARITMSVVGGQGFVFGRGNQQFSPAAIRRVGWESIDLICSEQKLAGLHAAALGVDTGDPALDAELCGYWQVTTGPGRRRVVRVTH